MRSAAKEPFGVVLTTNVIMKLEVQSAFELLSTTQGVQLLEWPRRSCSTYRQRGSNNAFVLGNFRASCTTAISFPAAWEVRVIAISVKSKPAYPADNAN